MSLLLGLPVLAVLTTLEGPGWISAPPTHQGRAPLAPVVQSRAPVVLPPPAPPPEPTRDTRYVGRATLLSVASVGALGIAGALRGSAWAEDPDTWVEFSFGASYGAGVGAALMLGFAGNAFGRAAVERGRARPAVAARAVGWSLFGFGAAALAARPAVFFTHPYLHERSPAVIAATEATWFGSFALVGVGAAVAMYGERLHAAWLRRASVQVVPTGNGIAVSGRF